MHSYNDAYVGTAGLARANNRTNLATDTDTPVERCSRHPCLSAGATTIDKKQLYYYYYYGAAARKLAMS